MKWTMQTFIAGYSLPDGTEVRHVQSLSEARDALMADHEEAERFGAAYEPSAALLWVGHLDDVTDIHPDREIVIGPRGGVASRLV